MKRGEKLEFYMREKGYNTSSLSKESTVAYTTIRSMLEKDLKNSSIDNVIKICKVLGIKVEDLLENETNNNIVKFSEISSHKYRYYPTTISAGLPITVDGICECGTIEMPDNIMGKYAGNKEIFFTRVNGESMNKIFPHESVISVKPITVEELKDGDIVVYSIGGEYGVKRFYKVDDMLIFKPESNNPVFTDNIYNAYNEDLKIQGKVVSYTVLMN